MNTQLPTPGESGSNSCLLVGATSNTGILGPQQQRRQQLVHCNAANAPTEHMTQKVHLKIVCKTERRKIKKQHAVGCGYIHIQVTSGQITISHTAGVCRELRNEIIAACNRKPPWSTREFVAIVREIEHHDVASSGIFVYEFSDMNPREWKKWASITSAKATEAYMVDVIAESHCQKQ